MSLCHKVTDKRSECNQSGDISDILDDSIDDSSDCRSSWWKLLHMSVFWASSWVTVWLYCWMCRRQNMQEAKRRESKKWRKRNGHEQNVQKAEHIWGRICREQNEQETKIIGSRTVACASDRVTFHGWKPSWSENLVKVTCSGHHHWSSLKLNFDLQTDGSHWLD